jgi:hypothetical protein
VPALIFATVGDRGMAAGTVTGGIDPLELLSLQARPNAIVVLDSSLSMFENTSSKGIGAGDSKSAKMYQAKKVLKTLVEDNQDNVSFMFGKYTPTAAPTLASGAYVYTTTDPNGASIRASAGGFTSEFSGGFGIEDSFTNVDGVTEYPLTSSTYRVNKTFRFRGSSGGTLCTETQTNPSPAWTAPAAGTDWRDAPPYIDIHYKSADCTSTNSVTKVRYYFRGVQWQLPTQSAACVGFDPLVNLTNCANEGEFSLIGPYLGAEVDPTSTADGGTPTITSAVKTSGYTPIAASLVKIKDLFNLDIWDPIKDDPVRPRTFVIFLTDGDDTCAAGGTSDTALNARTAAYRAQLLYGGVGTAPEFESRVPVFVVAFGSGASRDYANWIAWGGSGMVRTATDNIKWNTAPANKAGCPTCVDAFVAGDEDELSTALQAALDMGQSAGTFSDQQSITESIYEYSSLAPCTPACDPLDPETRYDSSIPVLLQTTFDMPQFAGHLNAFRNDAGTSVEVWDAGQKLYDRVVTGGLGDPSVATNVHTFSQLHADATAATIGGSAAKIKRRIYTTKQAGVSTFLDGADDAIVTALTTANYVPTEQMTLWPPGGPSAPGACTTSACVDPGCGASAPRCLAGVLDAALGLAASSYADFAAVKAAFPGVCTNAPSGAALPAGCSGSDKTFAIKEARQILLAFTAGAVLDTENSLAVRVSSSSCPANTSPCLRFRARPWILADSTLSAPGVIAPPIEADAGDFRKGEYKHYRDGLRDTAEHSVEAYSRGFGLRNPDKDGTAASKSNNLLKPNMTLVLHPTNEMLHAFRAGPCGAVCSDTGGEELWAFVPFDQLGKLKKRMGTQTRTDHTYMLASPVRFADVFVPGDLNETIGGVSVSQAGVWRTIALFGRGIGGKYLTALDVTTPGRLTDGALSGAPPIHLWTRGNPDTRDGTTGGTKNNQDGTQAANYDYNAYALMGETWSVPTISRVLAADNKTRRKSSGVDFVAYVGSGFSSVASEGSTFYALDMLTGDVIGTNTATGYYNVGDRSPLPEFKDPSDGLVKTYENAIVAYPAAFNKELLETTLHHPAAKPVTRVYVGDVHGRLWRFITTASSMAGTLFADLGVKQPIGNAAALLYYQGTQADKKPHVFVETGNDRRVAAPPAVPSPAFRMYGFRDDDLTSDPDTSDTVSGPATVLFAKDFPDAFRGTTQPATAYECTVPLDTEGQCPSDKYNGRVFFVGTRFNPTGAALPFEPPSPTPPCVSSFDSIIFALGAESGGAAYEFGTTEYYKWKGQKVQGVRVAGGQLVLDTGLEADNPPPPPKPPTAMPPEPSTTANVRFGSGQTNNLDANDNPLPIPGTMPFNMFGASTCK